jgi:hypothetical protein
MTRDAATTERLRKLISQLLLLTKKGDIRWERQQGSAHRYARWNNNLLILGPAEPINDKNFPRYLFITPFDSPSCIEINSDDEELGEFIGQLVAAVEVASQNEPPADPFALTDDILSRLGT